MGRRLRLGKPSIRHPGAKMKRTRLLAAVAALFVCAPLTAAATAHAATITMSGSTSIAPLATKLAKGFVNTPKGKGNKFVILQGGSDIGITDVSRGRVTIGISSRDPKPADPGGLVFNKIARDAVCIVTNKRQPDPDSRARRRSRTSSPAACAAGVRSRAPRRRARSTSSCVLPPPVPRTPSRTSSWARPARRRQRQTRSPPTACRRSRSRRTRTRSATPPSRSPGPAHDPLPGRALHPAQRQVRPVRRRA